MATPSICAMTTDRLKLLYWSQDTALFAYETGIQRVVRRLAENLVESGTIITPVGWDRQKRQIVSLPSASEACKLPLSSIDVNGAILFIPEIPLTLIHSEGLDPVQLGRAYGLHTAALVHDLIPIKRAGDYQPEVVELYRRYYKQFASADLIFATTNYVATDLAAFLRSEELRVPPIEVTPLPAALPSVPRKHQLPSSRGPHDPLKLISVVTWEPRKNILGLLHALQEFSRSSDTRMSLQLIGRRGVFPSYDEEVLEFARALDMVTIHGSVSDAKLVELYEGCHASVYPSVEEGFGLPIGESLWLGRPCLCHNSSSMAEMAPGGGTVLVDMSDKNAIVGALRRWLEVPDEIMRLASEAVERPLRDWTSFAADVAQRLSYWKLAK